MEGYTNTEIKKILRLDIGRQTLLQAEEEGRIPKAKRISRGKVEVRKWSLEDIPLIGQRYGKYKKPDEQKIICFYTGKGGVLKSTLTFNFARTLALNGIKTLIIGLDIQESITTLTLGEPSAENLNELESVYGLYDYLLEEVPIEKIIHPTDLPTLNIIPETFDLNILEKRLREKRKREEVFKKELIPAFKDYDVLVFDNSPNWNLLIENSLFASDYIVAPISCEIGTYQALEKNLNVLQEFKNQMEIHWKDYIMVPTLLENNKISRQILGAYTNQHTESITNGVIKRTVKGQESLAMKKSIFEYSGNSDLARDYDEVLKEI
jgi:chromosome partitioning protein